MTNRRTGILYVGVTGHLSKRAWEHREGVVDGFTKRYGLKILVYYESFDDIRDAVQREKIIKHWPRAWKVRLIHALNPEWKDLYDALIRERRSFLRHGRACPDHPRLPSSHKASRGCPAQGRA